MSGIIQPVSTLFARTQMTRPQTTTTMRRQQRRSFRGAALVVCVSLTATLSPSNAWSSRSTARRFASHKRPKSGLFLTREGDSSSNPNPRRQRRGANNKQQLNMATNAVEQPNSSKQPNRKKKISVATAIESQRNELLDHEIMTRKEELDLGAKVVRANQLRATMASLIEEKEASLEQEIIRQVYGNRGELSEDALLSLTEHQVDLDELTHFSIESIQEEPLFDPEGSPTFPGEEVPLENHFLNQQERGISGADCWDDRLLTDEEIVVGLQLPGGRAELQRILLEGAFARDCLIRNNVRLVVSIAKRWARQSAKFNNEDGWHMKAIYQGNAFRPSLDEAIQEGILGLARAADRYDPSRGLRFSTYSTYWVTNFVRNCFQRAETGSVRIPVQLHDIKRRYRTLLKSYYDSKGEIPSEEDLAKELGVTVKRLQTALRAAQRPLSIDSPINGVRKGSRAGGDTMGEAELLLTDTLQW